MSAAALGFESISISSLTERSISHYALYPGPYKRKLRRAVAGAARRAADADSVHWQFRGPTGIDDEGIVRILASPEQADPRGRTQQYQAIRSRLERGRRRRPRLEIPGQGSLFEDSDLENELDRATTVDLEEGGNEA